MNEVVSVDLEAGDHAPRSDCCTIKSNGQPGCYFLTMVCSETVNMGMLETGVCNSYT